jgi:hypothetical protein
MLHATQPVDMSATLMHHGNQFVFLEPDALRLADP